MAKNYGKAPAPIGKIPVQAHENKGIFRLATLLLLNGIVFVYLCIKRFE
jgi:hypothetical protein